MKKTFTHVYTALIGEVPTPGATAFFKHLSWIGVGFTLSKGIGFLVNLAAGRLLGPVEYGKVNLAVDVGTLLYSFSLWGMHNSIPKHGAQISEELPFRRMASPAILIVIMTSLLTGIVALTFSSSLSGGLHVTVSVLRFGMAYALGFTAFSVFTSIIQATDRFRDRAILEIVFSTLMGAGFFMGYVFLGQTFKVLAMALAGAYLITGTAAAWDTRALWRILRFDQAWFKRHLHYGIYGVGQSISFFLLANLQRLLLNAFVSTREAGIYSAYHISSIGQAYYASNAISLILLPKSSSAKSRSSVWRRISRGWLAASIPAFAGIALFQTLTIFLMGRQKFPLDMGSVIIFSLASLAIVVHGTFSSVLASEGTRGARFVFGTSLFMGLANILFGVLWVPSLAIMGAALAILVSYGMGLIWLLAARHRYM